MKKNLIIITSVLLVCILGGLGWYFFIREPKEVVNEDAQKFAAEYGIAEDNVFVYRSAEDIIRIMEKGTGVVYLGFPECPWCKAYVKYLNEVAKEQGIDKIYYYDILDDRKDNTPEYQKMVNILEEYLELDAEANARIYVPNVSFHVNGKIVGNDLETAYDTKGYNTPEEYWTEDEVKDLKERLTNYMKQVAKALATCTDCNK